MLANTALAAVGALPFGAACAQEGPFVYVPNGNDASVSRIDIPTNTVQPGAITVGLDAWQAAVRGDQALVYVTNRVPDSVSVIDTATNTVLTTINVGDNPQGIAINADGTRVYVANDASDNVSVIDTATNSVLTNINVGNLPTDVAVTPDGTRAYVTNVISDNVSVIDTATNTVLTTINVGNVPSRIAVSPNGTRAYVTNQADNTVTVIDTSTNTVLTAINVGNIPLGVGVTPDGTRAYVANDISDNVSVIDTATNTVLTTINVGDAPSGVAVSPDGTRVYVSNRLGDTVSVIDAATNTVIDTLNVGDGPRNPGICGNGNALLASGSTFIANIAGALACTGAGGPVFTGGTLRIDAANLASTLPMTLAAQGGTVDTQGNTATFSGAITGPGSLTKIGTGTLILAGANTYTGATNVDQGTLQAGAVDTFSPFSAFNVAAGATLDLNGFNQSIGSLAGAGSVLLGAATLTTGSDDSSTTFSGVIAGTGGLTKVGTGVFTLSGANTYTGATNVDAGILNVTGALASTVNVNPGATLGGTGTVGGLNVNGGTLSPGLSIGTITVAGSLVMTAASTYLVEVSPTAADRTNVTATASIAGAVQAVFQPGSYVPRSYTILHADGGLTGTFGALTTAGLPAGFTTSLSYTGSDVLLGLTASLGAGSNLNQNQRNVANALNSFFNGGGTLPPGFLGVFNLTGANLANALTLLSGEAATGAQQGAFQLTSQFLSLMLDPFVDGRSGVGGANGSAFGFAPEREAMPEDVALAYAKVMKAPPTQATPTFEQRWSVWGGGYGGYNKTSGDQVVIGSHDLSARTAGFAAGMDYLVAPGSVVGFALAGGGTGWSLAQGLGSGKSDAFQAGIYGATRSGPLYLAASLAYAAHWMSTDRVAIGGNHLTADFDAQSVGARLESGYRMGSPLAAMTPYAAVQWQSFRTPAYRETDVNGLGFGLAYNSRTGTATRSELGARFDQVVVASANAKLALRGRLAWAHDWISDPTLVAGFQSLAGSSFIVNGATPAQDLALVSAGADVRFANGVTLGGKFDGEFARGSATYGGTGTLRVSW